MPVEAREGARRDGARLQRAQVRGIRVMGWPAEKIVVKDNRHLGAKPGKLLNEASAAVASNTNYEVSTPARK